MYGYIYIYIYICHQHTVIMLQIPKWYSNTIHISSPLARTAWQQIGKDATHQPFGYVDPKTGSQLPVIANTWKALLHPTTAGGDYTITATCHGCVSNTTATLSHVTFGDFWYCSGQSNMWLPVQYTFSRNKTVAAIKAGKFRNIRGMFSPSATTPTAGQWKTAQQAIEDGNETHPTYSLFQVVSMTIFYSDLFQASYFHCPKVSLRAMAKCEMKTAPHQTQLIPHRTNTQRQPCPPTGRNVLVLRSGSCFARREDPHRNRRHRHWGPKDRGVHEQQVLPRRPCLPGRHPPTRAPRRLERTTVC